jgi:predicted component of type VI protein secretion system
MSHSVTLIPLENFWVTLYSARLEDERLLREAKFYLAVRCHDLREDRIKEMFPYVAKVGWREDMDTIISALPGVRLTHEPLPPPQITAPREGFQWFILDTEGAYWERVKHFKNICVRVTEQIPEPELELYAVCPIDT